ncbi:PREDICTED: uncharacterized protein LOC109159160 [Ipomoea nil]|uniref:uncharacterized protein LOC109159160 n=1 Tax=Ipomoea nil TaxID=35883 RepID=UPI000901FC5C|nr:PREDICTED: uncharacterized protein LOC109159160 [Ipomoea nil]
MSSSDSQNASIGDYDQEVERYSEEEIDIMSYSPEVAQRPGKAPERAATPQEPARTSRSLGSSSSGSESSGSEETSTSGRDLPSRGVRETPTGVIGDHPDAISRPSGEPVEEDEEMAEPAARVDDDGFQFLNSDSVAEEMSDLTKGEATRIAERLSGRVEFDTNRRLGNVIDWHQGKWIGMHYDSLLAPIEFPFPAILTAFLGYYRVVPAQICPNSHRILACFTQICARHQVACSMELFNYIYQVKVLSPNYGGGFFMMQSREGRCTIAGLPGNNKGWKNRIFSVKYDPWILPVDRVWSTHFRKQVVPEETPLLREAVMRTSSEVHEYRIFRTAESLAAARLPDPVYDLKEKYKPVPMGVVPGDPARRKRKTADMAPKRIVRPTSPPRTKIALGKKKPAGGTSEETSIPVGRPVNPVTLVTEEGGVVDASETLVTRVTSKSKGSSSSRPDETSAREVAGNKRKRSEKSPTPTIGSGMADASILSRIGNLTPVGAELSKLSSTQLAERLGYGLTEVSRIGAILHGQALLATEADRYKKLADRRLKDNAEQALQLKRAKEALEKKETEQGTLLKKMAELRDRLKRSEARSSDPDEAVKFFFRDVAPGMEFMRKMRSNVIADEIVWTFGTWAYSTGEKDMRDRTEKNMREALDGEDLELVLTTLPRALPDPGQDPFDPELEIIEPSRAAAEVEPAGKNAAAPSDAEAAKK